MELAFTLGGGLLAHPFAGEALSVYWLRAFVLGAVWTGVMAVFFRLRGRHLRR